MTGAEMCMLGVAGMTWLPSTRGAPESSQAKLDVQIAAARAVIGHGSDGPCTSFVLIARATEYAARNPTCERAAAEALMLELEEYGHLVAGHDTPWDAGT